MRILVTGGGGYVGSILVPMLLAEGHEVVVYDSFCYGQVTLMDVVHDARLRIVRGDVRDLPALRAAAEGVDAAVHLAAVVGAPACHQEPERSWEVNVTGTRNLLEAVEGLPVVFASTGSCYGAVDGVCTEDTPVAPLSEYGEQKVEAEALVRKREAPWLVLRFATVFGASPRPRLDLLVNDLVYQAVTKRSLVVYEAEYRRTFLHVRDAARAFVWSLTPHDVEGDKYGFQHTPAPVMHLTRRSRVYNVGHPEMGLTKREVAEAVVRRVPGCLLNLAGEGKDADQRNYAVSYDRMLAGGFKPSVSFEAGLDEVLKSFQVLRVSNPYSNAG